MKIVIYILFFLFTLCASAQKPQCITSGLGVAAAVQYPLTGSTPMIVTASGLTPCTIYNICFPFNSATDWIEIFQVAANSDGMLQVVFNDSKASYLQYSHLPIASGTKLMIKVIQPYGVNLCGSQKLMKTDVCECYYYAK